MFVGSQLFFLNAGATSRLQLCVLPVYRGGRVVVPAPRAGSVPVVTLRELVGGRVMRFIGTRLGANLCSIVTMAPPSSSVTRRWTISVHSSGRVYPDLTDSPVTITANLQSSRAQPAASRRRGGDPPWPLIVGALVCALSAAAVAWALIRRRDGRPLVRRSGAWAHRWR